MSAKLRVGFAGTPDFAARALAAIVDAGYDVPLVLTQPDRPSGRGLRRTAGVVKVYALERGLKLLQPSSLKAPAQRDEVTAIALDVLVVAAYGLILPRQILDWPRHGCINIHASLLPRWRGAAPIERALLAGDSETGISIMQMDPGLDTGPIIATRVVPIDPRDTSATLGSRLAYEGADAIVEVLARLQRDGGPLEAAPQPVAGASYAMKIRPDEAEIDWNASAASIERKVRAFDPSPGASTTLAGEVVKIRRAESVPGRFGVPGMVVRADADGIVVSAGEGAVIVRELQRAGGKRLPAEAFLAGRPIAKNASFGPARA